MFNRIQLLSEVTSGMGKNDVPSLLSSLTAHKNSVKRYLIRSFPAKITVCVRSPWVVVDGGMELSADKPESRVSDA